jgi:UDP-glucose 4-epimerase
VAVTGASGYVGSRLVESLEAEDGVGMVLAMDVRPPAVSFGAKVAFLQQDVSVPFLRAFASHEIGTVVHLAYVLRQGRNREANRRVNVGGTANLLAACAEAGVRKIVYLSSTSVYGAHPDNPSYLKEGSPARPARGFQYSEDKAGCEALIDAFVAERPDTVATVLRCCPVMGPNAGNFIAGAFLKPFLVKVRGSDPAMQFVHEDDLAGCIVRCILDDAPGLYNVAGDGTVRWSEMAAMLGRRMLSLPAWLLYPATDAAWRLRLQSDSPSVGLDFIRYPWAASTEKIKSELGIEFRHTSREAWEAFASRQSGSTPTRDRDS